MAYASLAFELDTEYAERLTDTLLELGAQSVAAEDAAAGTPMEQPLFDEPGEAAVWPRVKLRVLVGEDADPWRLIEHACAQAQVKVPERLEVESVAERDWVRDAQAQFESIQISDRLWVVPSWHTPPQSPAVSLLLDPGVAFGTGSHPTTRLCLQWLERHLRGGETVLDYGCGSGILAIAAMKLGAARVTGVDIDPAAIAAARENAGRNRVACEFLDSQAPLACDADIIVANILANPLKLLAPLLAQHARPGGRIALSGILDKQQRELEDSYTQWFDFEAPTRADGWICLSGKRRAGRP